MRKQLLSLLLAFLLITPAHVEVAGTAEDGNIDYELGCSTDFSGGKLMWVRREFSDVPEDHWFYPALQKYRRLGIVTGDQYGNVALERPVTADEVYTLFVRYIYATDIQGNEIGGAISGDYIYNGHAAWQDAYAEVNDRLASTIKAVSHNISLPGGRESKITRKRAFVLYCMAELSRCKDPVWYFNQFSSKRLGSYARSNAPIRTYETGQPVAGFFSALDQEQMTPLEIQSANMLMYLGVLNGTEGHSLEPNRIVMRAEAIKLLAGVDLVDASPHLNDEDDGNNGDWGGSAGEYPEPPADPVSHESASILFVDWDNTELGSLIVLSNQDVSEQVGEYVQRFIHPELRGGKAFADSSRDTNYRGKYDGHPDGADYPLTSHLDYNFIGWVPCTILNYENTGTTVGVGELANSRPELVDFSQGISETIVCKAAYEPGPLLMTGEDAMYTLASPPDILYINGRKLKDADEIVAYALEPEDQNGQIRYGLENERVIDIYFYFERVAYDDKGQVHGVERARELVMDLRYVADLWYRANGETHMVNEPMNEQGVYLYGGHVKIPNIPQGDSVNFRIQITGGVFRISYALVDTYGANFVTGKVRSHNNEWYYCHEPEKYIPTNFNYLTVDTDISDEFYDCGIEERYGTEGFIMTAFLRGLCFTAYLDYLDGVAENVEGKIHGCEFKEMAQINNVVVPYTWDVEKWINAAYHAVCDVAENHYQEEGWWDKLRDMPSLSFHQFQLYVNDYAVDPDSAHVLPREVADNTLVPNCRIHVACQAAG